VAAISDRKSSNSVGPAAAGSLGASAGAMPPGAGGGGRQGLRCGAWFAFRAPRLGRDGGFGRHGGLGPVGGFPANQHAGLVRAQCLLAHGLERDDPVERAEQLADVVDVEPRDRVEHALGEAGPPLFGLAAENGDAGLVVGGGHVDDEATREATDETLVQGLDIGRRPVAGEDDLTARSLQRVGQPQQLGLHLPPVGEELHVIHQQQVHIEEPLAVGLAVAGRDGRVKRFDELVQGEILHRQARVDRPSRVPDGHEQMGLAETGTGVDEQRVVHGARRLGYRLGGGHRQPVGRADHQRVEPVQGVERDGHATGLPTASRLSTSSETPRRVSNTPLPWSASAA
jgi:hypothetical protein